jgi:hypothetical protein
VFKQGHRPALVVRKAQLPRFRACLARAGYRPHTGARYERRGEIAAWTADVQGGRHVHVQEVDLGEGRIAVFAHTEAASGWRHWVSALTDGHSFAAGSRKLRSDLRLAGWRVRS